MALLREIFDRSAIVKKRGGAPCVFGRVTLKKSHSHFGAGWRNDKVGGLEYPKCQWKLIVEGKKKFVQALMISCCEWRRLVGVL